MNRNNEAHFAELPSIDIQRSKFNRPSEHKTSLNTGDLVPFYIDEVLPADTMSIDVAAVIRMATPIFPVMDNAYADLYFFFVPRRLIWEHWREFMGENTASHWEQTVEYTIPQITAPAGGWAKGTIADYMGIPTGINGLSIDSAYFKAYSLIWNEWFRDQNIKDPCMINKGDETLNGSNGDNYITDAQLGGKPCKVAKFHDYFTSVLPQPQKGEQVLIPLGNLAPVTLGPSHDVNADYTMSWKRLDGQNFQASNTYVNIQRASDPKVGLTIAGATGGEETGYHKIAPNNLWADLGNATAATISQLRQAFQIQKYLERDARSGSRYTELLRSHWSVVSSDARLQRPEYLGGERFMINMSQVVQTSSTDEVSPQGNTAAYSLTTINKHMFTKSFEEHGIIIGLIAIRTNHTYQQGIEKIFSRRTKFDFYTPEFASLGDMPVYNRELYAQGNATDDEVFGYQEAWAEYRYKPSRVSGAFRSNYQQPLDSYHYADYYEAQPFYSSDWIDETRVNVDRTIAVSSELEDQFIADILTDNTCVRAMPVYSVPGLIDHH